MGTYTSEDEVLELNADFSDFTSDDEKVIEKKTETITDPVINEKIWMKFFRKGKVSLRDIRDDLLRILVKVYGAKQQDNQKEKETFIALQSDRKHQLMNYTQHFQLIN
ncbi:hypothetical protein ACKWTF_007674 [Chironomus riparius]